MNLTFFEDLIAAQASAVRTTWFCDHRRMASDEPVLASVKAIDKTPDQAIVGALGATTATAAHGRF